MFIFISIEFGADYAVWDYPGNADQLEADWNAGHTPFHRPLIPGTMPPACRQEQEYVGRLLDRSDMDANGQSIDAWIEESDAFMSVHAYPDSLSLPGDRELTDPTQPPREDEDDNGLHPLATAHVSTSQIRHLLIGNLSPYNARWICHHLHHCDECARHLKAN